MRIGRVHRITSIADLISSRYGKSSTLAVLVTLIAVVAVTPYIALQLQSRDPQLRGDRRPRRPAGAASPSWIAAGLALFTILFGTRNLDANERHHGVVAAIAVEAIVKLVALLAVGIFVVFGRRRRARRRLRRRAGRDDPRARHFGPRWVAMTVPVRPPPSSACRGSSR